MTDKWGKVTYFDGSYAVGPINTKADSVVLGNGLAYMPIDPDYGQNRPVFTYIDAPKPAEPTGLGAVVSAILKGADGTAYYIGTFVRGQSNRYSETDIWENTNNDFYDWDDLHNVKILHEGYAG